ncbi:Arc family DNA-binding protein [Shuttleworthella satelles]|uniref:Arc family DNA-binding protein n=1 Tax=Shuttleworthella satelles TaxID=177972 RepID=UPI0009FF8545|nr:Arc family DNA-binding protein [Shuttleworthia satelles]
MTKERHHFAVRTDRETLDKFKYVAEFNARSANRELELLMRQHIKRFEDSHGKIDLTNAV